MAADLHLLDMCVAEPILYLRVYTWVKPSITIGLLQKPEEVLDIDAINRDEVEWIRRPTGGRAVLHFEDLTYSCVFSQKVSALGTSIKETYALISRCLKNGLNRAGILSETHDSEDQFKELKREHKLPCFLAPNRDEIMVNGKKLVGSAQRRTLSSVLQHGSLPISEAYLRLPDYLNISDHDKTVQKQLLKKKTINIDAIQPGISFSDLAKHIVWGFKTTLNVPIIDLGWSSEEIACIESIKNSHKFRHEYCF